MKMKMGIPFPSLISHFTPVTLPYLLLLISTTAHPIFTLNITNILSSSPNFSSFSSLLSSTGVAAEINTRNSITLLAVPNSFLGASVDLTRRLSLSSLADLLRYHVLLQYLSPADIRRLPPSGGVITTLYQATGRAYSGSGSVNITRDPVTEAVTVFSPPSSSNATVLKVVKAVPYNITVLAVDSLLVPSGFDLMVSETQPPLGLNITQLLINGHDFNVAISILTASGVVSDFEQDERGAGITLFIPTDRAFSDLPATVRLQSLPAEKKATMLKFHVLHSYYPLGTLESIVNPVQPTLATEEVGAGSYTLNISKVNDSVCIDSGIVQAKVTQTVFDQNPVAIFGVSKVLLPRELFGSVGSPGEHGDAGARAVEPPEISPPPGNSPASTDTPSRLLSPPEEIDSGAGLYRLRRTCIALALALYVLV